MATTTKVKFRPRDEVRVVDAAGEKDDLGYAAYVVSATRKYIRVRLAEGGEHIELGFPADYGGTFRDPHPALVIAGRPLYLLHMSEYEERVDARHFAHTMRVLHLQLEDMPKTQRDALLAPIQEAVEKFREEKTNMARLGGALALIGGKGK